jgi:hypothetical protein
VREKGGVTPDEHMKQSVDFAVERMRQERGLSSYEQHRLSNFVCVSMSGFELLSPIKQWYLLKMEQDGVKI